MLGARVQLVPNKEALIPQILKLISDGDEHCFEEVNERLAKLFNLSKDDLEERTPSDYTTRFRSNIAWSVTDLVQQKRIERTRRGCFKLVPGKEAAGKMPAYKAEPILSDMQSSTSNRLPEEMMEDIYKQINMKLAQEVLAEVKNASPQFLESLVLDLLRKMGYGKEVNAAGKRVGRTADGGIDGFVKEDQLGFNVVYYQAKRWTGESTSVPPREVRDFSGSLDKYPNSTKGVFITTAQFSNDAKEYVKNHPKKIVLIDGEELARLMVEHGVEVTVSKNYQIKEIDTDYFEKGKV